MKKAFLLVLLVFFSITLQAVEYAVKVTRNGEALPTLPARELCSTRTSLI